MTPEGEIHHCRRSAGFLRPAVDRTLDATAGVLLAAMMIDVLLGIADRFILHIGWPWPEEIGRFLLAWVALLGAAIAVGNEEHFAVVYFIEKRLPGRFLSVLRAFQHLITFIAACGFMVLGAHIAVTQSVRTSPGAGIPMSWVFMAMPVSAALMIYYTLMNAFCGRSTPPEGATPLHVPGKGL